MICAQTMGTMGLGDLSIVIPKLRIFANAWKTVSVGGLCLFVVGAASVSLMAQRTYTSRMVAPLSAKMLALLKTEVVLDAMIEAAGSERKSSNVEFSRKPLAERIIVSGELAPESGLYSIGVTDATPEGAQKILNELLKQLSNLSKPSGSSRAAMMEELDSLNDTLAHLRKLADKLAENAANVKAGDDGEMYARAFVHLLSDIGAKEARIRELQDALEGWRSEDIVVPPTLPINSDPSRLFRNLVLVWLGSFVLVALLVFLREELRGERTPMAP